MQSSYREGNGGNMREFAQCGNFFRIAAHRVTFFEKKTVFRYAPGECVKQISGLYRFQLRHSVFQKLQKVEQFTGHQYIITNHQPVKVVSYPLCSFQDIEIKILLDESRLICHLKSFD